MSEQLHKNLIHKLSQKKRFGESRHQAKLDGTAHLYIYSGRTYDTYKKQLILFIDWCEKEHNITKVTEGKKYVQEYIDKLIDENKSPYSQKTALAAIRKLYGKQFENVKTESRSRSLIKRSRMDTPSQRHFSERNNAELIHFCKHTGLRRKELESLKGGCVIQKNNGKFYIKGVKGKGGRVRDIEILNNDQKVIDKITNTPKDQLVWGPVHSKANIHGYRANYAQSIYDVYKRDLKTLTHKEKYFCRKDMAGIHLDRKAMMEVSYNLGHSRESISAGHYIYDLARLIVTGENNLD